MICNPFVTNGYVGADFFCDRVNETRQIIDGLENGNNLFLSSPRRLGKTGLIEHCFSQKEVQQKYITIVVDIYSTKNLQDFVCTLGCRVFSEIKKQDRSIWGQFIDVVTSLKAGVSFDMSGNPELSLGLGDVSNPALTLDQIFEYLNVSSKPCLVAIDEFQAIASYPERNVEAILRSYIQKTNNSHFIFSGSHRHLMTEMFCSPARPFFQSSTPITLSQIASDVYYEFAKRHFMDAKKDIDREAFDFIYGMFDGVTWYVQFLLNKLYAITQSGEVCTVAMVDNAMDEVFKTFDVLFDNMLFQLPFKQKEVLIAIAREGQAENVTSKSFLQKYSLTASSVQAAIRGLVEKDFVTCEMGRYSVYDKFFAIWLRRR